MIRRLVFVLLVCGLSAISSNAFAGDVRVTIDISEQKMYVSVDGKRKYSWPVSTGRKGYRTPVGSYGPTRMYKRYFSKKYHGSPMPYSIFFRGGYAIHGTNDIKRLGRVASHGCVRLHPDNAKRLYSLVKSNGSKRTRIRVRS